MERGKNLESNSLPAEDQQRLLSAIELLPSAKQKLVLGLVIEHLIPVLSDSASPEADVHRFASLIHDRLNQLKRQRDYYSNLREKDPEGTRKAERERQRKHRHPEQS